MTIELEYGLCTVERPWLIGDLFYLRNWYLVDHEKHAISTGDIEGQKLDQDKLLPMIPRQFLFARSETIMGGTSEIQRNVIAQRILGLPR